MTDPTVNTARAAGSVDPSTDIDPAAISDPFKILGDFPNASGGIGVLARNTASTGTTKGVEGPVTSTSGCGRYTPDVARIEGLTETLMGRVGDGAGDTSRFSITEDANDNPPVANGGTRARVGDERRQQRDRRTDRERHAMAGRDPLVEDGTARPASPSERIGAPEDRG